MSIEKTTPDVHLFVAGKNGDTPHPDDNHHEIISYQKLRTFIGITGLLLPVALVFGSYVFVAGNYSWQHSISHYYYSQMHIVFVCILCVLGGFLITYKGKPEDPWESRVANIAGYSAFGVAAFPTQFAGFRPDSGGSNQYLSLMQDVSATWGSIHFAMAGLLFLCFIIFCLHFFQRPDADYSADYLALNKFRRRKRVYKICGWGIAVSIACIALFSFIIKSNQGILAYTTFIFETTALWFFGTAWMVKGSGTLKRVRVLSSLVAPLR